MFPVDDLPSPDSKRRDALLELRGRTPSRPAARRRLARLWSPLAVSHLYAIIPAPSAAPRGVCGHGHTPQNTMDF
jgi:hypothetical protein